MSGAHRAVFDALDKARRDRATASEATAARSTDDIVAELRGATFSLATIDAAADRLCTQQALLRLAAPTTIGDELMELRLLAIEGAARELEVLADAAWMQARLPHGKEAPDVPL